MASENEVSSTQGKKPATGRLFCPSCKSHYPSYMDKCDDCGLGLVQLSEDPLIGSTFAERYEILSALGTGGMSVVYKARQKFMDKLVAIKILHPQLSADPVNFERFQLEAKAASSLSHPNVVQVLDFGVTPAGQAFLIMEYLDGATLQDYIEEHGFMDLKMAMNVFVQASGGLAHAHAKSLIHRDLKPGNLVMVKAENGTELVKIVDFGIAKFLPSGENMLQSLTQAGEVFGSPLYMSPEQCKAAKLDERSDIYSFGCVMYETLSGMPPFVGENPFETMSKHVYDQAAPFAQTASKQKVPVDIERVILKSLHKEPADRYQSMADLRNELAEAAEKNNVDVQLVAPLPVVQTFTNPPSADSRKHQLERSLKVSMALLAIVSLAAGSFLFMPGPTGDAAPLWKKSLWRGMMEMGDLDRRNNHVAESAKWYKHAAEYASDFADDRNKRLVSLRSLIALYKEYPDAPGSKAGGDGAKRELYKDSVERMEALYSDSQDLPKLESADLHLIPHDLDAKTAAEYTNRLVADARDRLKHGQFVKAESYLEEAIITEEETNGIGRQAISSLANEMAQSPRCLSHLAEMNNLLDRALKEQLSNGKGDALTVTTMLHLGESYHANGEDDKAEEQIKSAIALAKTLGDERVLTITCLNTYATLLEANKRSKEAAKIHAEAERLKRG